MDGKNLKVEKCQGKADSNYWQRDSYTNIVMSPFDEMLQKEKESLKACQQKRDS